MQTTVKKWFPDKGYGFLRNGSDAAPDIIVYATELKNCSYLKPGRKVEFECHTNNRGLVAKNVKLIHEHNNRQPESQRYHNSHPYHGNAR